MGEVYPTNPLTTDLIKSIKGHLLDYETLEEATSTYFYDYCNIEDDIWEDLPEDEQNYNRDLVIKVVSSLVKVLYREWN